MMSFGIQDGGLAKSGDFGMRQGFEEGEFRRLAENLRGDPSAVRPTILSKAGVTPTGLQLTDASGGLQDLMGQLVGVDDIESELRKAGGRRGLAATDTARESDDHALPYLPGPPRANLKRGWVRTGGPGRRRPQGWRQAERLQSPEQARRPVRQSPSG